MKKTKLKRIFCLLLAAMFIVGLLPTVSVAVASDTAVAEDRVNGDSGIDDLNGDNKGGSDDTEIDEFMSDAPDGLDADEDQKLDGKAEENDEKDDEKDEESPELQTRSALRTVKTSDIGPDDSSEKDDETDEDDEQSSVSDIIDSQGDGSESDSEDDGEGQDAESGNGQDKPEDQSKPENPSIIITSSGDDGDQKQNSDTNSDADTPEEQTNNNEDNEPEDGADEELSEDEAPIEIDADCVPGEENEESLPPAADVQGLAVKDIKSARTALIEIAGLEEDVADAVAEELFGPKTRGAKAITRSGESALPTSADGNSIDTVSLKWLTEDTVDDEDDAHLALTLLSSLQT